MYYLLAFVYLTAAHSAASLLLIPVCTHSNGSNLVSLNPYFVTGFSDAESCFFFIGLYPSNPTGYQVQAIFQISLYNNDSALLSQIQSYFGPSSRKNL